MSDERVEEEFDLLDDLTISPGNYGGPGAYFGASSSRRRSLSVASHIHGPTGFMEGTGKASILVSTKTSSPCPNQFFGGQGQH